MNNNFPIFLSMKRHWAKLYFVLSLTLVAFAYGYSVNEYRIFPYGVLQDGMEAVLDWKKNWKTYSVRPYQKFLSPSLHSGSGVVINKPDKTSKGVTFITGLIGESLGMMLIDMEGRVINQWKVSFNEIWPVAPHLEKQPGDFHQGINGAKLYENGDVVFNFHRKGMVKIDKCSKVIWKLPYKSHHSVYEDKEGNLWFPSEKKQTTRISNLITIEPSEYIFKVSPEGKLLKEINIIEVILRSGLVSSLYTGGKNERRMTTTGQQYTHLNDVEILEGSKAEAFPLFNEGDIMTSLRNRNLIVIIDPDTETIKWSMTGPFVQQHDPDFLDNGRISIFDNLGGKGSGEELKGSRIIEVDPVTNQTAALYEGDEENPFFSGEQGNHQHLPNGNILITESQRGRVFEVNGEGEIVWSYIYRWDEDEVVQTYQATRYPESFGTINTEPCSQAPINNER